jgi:hypothetical protein
MINMTPEQHVQKQLEVLDQLFPDLVVVNCTQCKTLLRLPGSGKKVLAAAIREGRFTKEQWQAKLRSKMPQQVAGRIGGKPYCRDCVELADRLLRSDPESPEDRHERILGPLL